MHLTISITAAQAGWALRGDTIENGMMFLSGAQAERAARSLAERYCEAGQPTEVEIFLRDGSLAGRYVAAPDELRLAGPGPALDWAKGRRPRVS